MKQVIITLMLSLFLVQFQGLSYADSLPVPAPDPDSLFGVDLNINVIKLVSLEPRKATIVRRNFQLIQ